MKNIKEKMFKELSLKNPQINISNRIFYLKTLCIDDYYRSKLINQTEIVRRLKKIELSMVLPMIWQDENINHTRVILLLQVYKCETSDKIVNSLKINKEVKDFYLKIYRDYMEKRELIDVANKLDPDNFIEYQYTFDEDYGRIKM